MILSECIIKDYFIPYLDNKWKEMQLEALRYPKRRFPFAIHEAVLNTAITGSIFRFLHDKNDFTSTLVSEAPVKRTYTNKGKCDIIWYFHEAVYYVELKGTFLYDTAEASKNAALGQQFGLGKAYAELHSILADDLIDKGMTENELFYGYLPKRRYGFVGAILFSNTEKEETSFANYKKVLTEDELIIGDNIKLSVHGNQFEGIHLDISFHQGGEKVLTKTDGYFFLYAEFEILAS